MEDSGIMASRKTSHQRSSRAIAVARALAQHTDELLDEALAETFPASDPVSIDVVDWESVGKVPARARH